MRKINPARLRLRLEFGHSETATSVNGVNVNKFVCDAVVWGGIYTNSMTQQYALMGQGLTDTKSFIVRHNERLQDCTQLRCNGKVYGNLQFNVDPYNSHDSFDVVTGKKVTQRGR